MQNIQTYKAISNRVFLFGFRLVDLGISIVIPFMLWVISDSFKLAFVVFIVTIYISKKFKYRPEGYERSFLSFLFTPYRFSVDDKDIPSYKEVKCRK